MKIKKFKNQKGSTIIELLISLMIVGLVVTAVAVAGTYSIKNTGEARFRQVATTLGQEVMEKTKNEKTRLGFLSFASAVGSNTYCFDEIPEAFDNLSGEPPMPSEGICGVGDTVAMAGADFTRQIIFTTTLTEVTATVGVSWSDSGNIRTVELVQELSDPNQKY